MPHDEAQSDSPRPHFDAQREHELLAAWQQGDDSALSDLLVCFEPRIWSICWRTVGHAEDASDLAQDAIIKVMNGLANFDGRSKLSTWVIRITINCCLSHLRKQKIRRHASLEAHIRGAEVSLGDRIASEEPGPSSGVEQRDLHQSLQASFLTLDKEQQLLLALRDVQGMEYAQLAEIYEVPIGTIKSRLFRARVALRERLEAESGTAEDPSDGSAGHTHGNEA
ncbi:MAG: sigma-70 family RNA polymerase sigma factor [Phycisphaerales bacterium]|nr:sigma-70 family RNA polymerase sigma factor [Phycisphaerales bacterium]